MAGEGSLRLGFATDFADFHGFFIRKGLRFAKGLPQIARISTDFFLEEGFASRRFCHRLRGFPRIFFRLVPVEYFPQMAQTRRSVHAQIAQIFHSVMYTHFDITEHSTTGRSAISACVINDGSPRSAGNTLRRVSAICGKHSTTRNSAGNYVTPWKIIHSNYFLPSGNT